MTGGRPLVAVAVAADADPEPWLAALAPRLPGFAVRALPDIEDPAAVRYGLAWKHVPGSLARCRALRALFSLGAGVDHLVADSDLPRGVPIGRVVDPDLTARMREWVCLHVLMHHRQQRRYDAQQARRLWLDDLGQPAAREVRVGVMGLGEMGRAAAGALQALGFDVAGWSRTAKRLTAMPTFAGASELDAFLGRTEILVALLPLTPDTRGLLARPVFERLARDGRGGSPVLVNGGRGALQNEADILSCLDDGTLRAATLDVFETEPLPDASRLWAHPAVTVTPHNAAISSPAAVSALLASQIVAVEAGQPLAHAVDLVAGY